jgi:putative hydrolase of the HAD superfamily
VELMPLTDFSVLTMDVVGTQIDEERGLLDYMRPIISASGVTVPDRDLLEAFAEAEVEHQRLGPHLPFTAFLVPVYKTVAQKFGLPAGDREADGLVESVHRWPAYPDCHEALRRLKRQFLLVAVTNSSNRALDAFSATLGHPFDDRITAEDVRANKPDPLVFEHVKARLASRGFGVDNTLHVAQSQFHDIAIAKKLGFTVCWIERRAGQDGFGATPQPQEVTRSDYHFKSLSELADAVEGGK